ncbi:MAG: hypothetical protein K2X66_04110, partial [Cyanobacteria bacterium]|nr:hypothetical protein [Cyanobacteriota bacterium]
MESSPVVLNDLHSKLNPTCVAGVLKISTSSALQTAIQQAAEAGLKVSVSGGRHAMGGQQFGENTLHLDTTEMN